jgi:hypothetical protein
MNMLGSTPVRFRGPHARRGSDTRLLAATAGDRQNDHPDRCCPHVAGLGLAEIGEAWSCDSAHWSWKGWGRFAANRCDHSPGRSSSMDDSEL